MHEEYWVENSQGDKLSVWVEGNSDADTTVLFVHGFGSSKRRAFWDPMAEKLSRSYRVVRFDFSSYGDSEGAEEDSDYNKFVEDLEAVLVWARDRWSGDYHIIAHSMGCFITAMLSPKSIKKAVFIGIPNGDTSNLANFLKERIINRGGTVDENGVSSYPRSSGEVHKLGPSFWRVMRELDPVSVISSFAEDTNLVIIRPKDDEIVAPEGVECYKSIENTEFIELSGSHNFEDSKEREGLLNYVSDLLNKD